MKVYKIATLILMMFSVLVFGFAQKQQTKQVTTPENLERGVIGTLTSNVSWSGYSTLTLIPGAGLIPITSTQTVFYLGFAAGSEADITNMVLYTTARGNSTITAVTPVKLGGVSNPSIILSSTSTCPNQPLSATSPCIVRLDPTALTLSALNDYYLVVYFTPSDSNNGSLGLTQPNYGLSSLLGWYIGSTNETTLTVGQSIPSGCCTTNYMTMYVMSD